jgi:hypothetical protein
MVLLSTCVLGCKVYSCAPYALSSGAELVGL